MEGAIRTLEFWRAFETWISRVEEHIQMWDEQISATKNFARHSTVKLRPALIACTNIVQLIPRLNFQCGQRLKMRNDSKKLQLLRRESVDEQCAWTVSGEIFTFSAINDSGIQKWFFRIAWIWTLIPCQQDVPRWFHFGAHRFHFGILKYLSLRVQSIKVHKHSTKPHDIVCWIHWLSRWMSGFNLTCQCYWLFVPSGRPFMPIPIYRETLLG
jgi:hypothetical protein